MSEKNGLPIVSAIITTHNRNKLAIKAINSVTMQSYPNIELIVVDDASDPEEAKAIKEKAQECEANYIYISSADSKGGNHARNVGIEASNGELIAFLDDDDEWLSKKIEKQVAFLLEHADYGVVSCLRIKEYNFKKRVLEPSKYKVEGDIHIKIFTLIPFLTSTVMIRKELLERIECFDEELRYWQEYDLAIRYAQQSKVGIIKEHLCLYRIIIKDKNRLSNNLNGWEASVKHIEKKYALLIDKLPPEMKQAHQLMILKDGQKRASNAGNRKCAVNYGWRVLKKSPSVKNLIKLVLSLLGIRWQ